MPRKKQQPVEKPEWRLYRCRHYTGLRLGNMVTFANGAFATDDPVLIDIVEQSKDFKAGEIYRVEDAS